jgi:chitinase
VCALTPEGAVTRVDVPAGTHAVVLTLGPTRGNAAPVAALTAPATAFANESAVLDASASCDADGPSLVFEWTLVSGPAGARLSGSGARVTFTGAAGEHRVAVVVSDGQANDRAEAVVRVVTRPSTPPPPAPPASGGGCSLAAGGGASCVALFALALALARRRRRARRR